MDNIEIKGNMLNYKGYELTLLNTLNSIMGYCLVYKPTNDLVSWGADVITDVIDDLKKDLDNFIRYRTLMDMAYDYDHFEPIVVNDKIMYKNSLIDEIIDENGLMEWYFEDNANWVYQDHGYEIHDCEFYLKQAKDVNNEHYIKVFTDILEQLKSDEKIVKNQYKENE